MSNIIHSKPYRNWVSGALGLLYVQKGLYPFTDRVVKAEHGRILQNLATCTSCTVKNIQPAHASGKGCIYDYRNKVKCNCRKSKNMVACYTCGQLYDEIITKHRFKDPLWVTDASTWCTDHWQIAKCFMSTTTLLSNNTAADTDAAGLLNIIINSDFFQSEIDSTNPPRDRFSKVRQIRNDILHNSTHQLSDTELTNYLHAMITVLEDQKTLLSDPSAQAAVKKLKEMVKDELVVTTKEEAKAIQTALDAIKEAKEKYEEHLRELTEEGENRVKNTAEQCEENLQKLAEEKRNSLQKQASEAHQDIETAKVTAVTEVRAAVSSVFEENYEPKVKKLKLHDDLEKRTIAVEKKQCDLAVNPQKLLNSTGIKHKARLEYLKQKQDLQQHLVELYQKHYVKTWLSPLMTEDNDVNISDVYVSPNMVVEQDDDKDINKPEAFTKNEVGLTHMITNKVSEKSADLKQVPINSYQDIFRSRDGKNKRIYIVGDVGTGKSSFCKMMMQNWCRDVTGKSENREPDDIGNENMGPENDDNKRVFSAFEFLFYVPLRFMSVDTDDIAEMIKTQLKDYSTLIDKIFSDESECCLILADGLDEWTPPQTSVPRLPYITYGLPTSPLKSSATIITTSRPSARGILDMKSSECDLKVNLLGIKEMKSMIVKYMALFDKSPSAVKDLSRKLQTCNLRNLQNAPMLLQQIIWMYYKKYPIDKSITYMYSHIVNITLAWMHEKGGERLALTNFQNTSIVQLPLPEVFKEYSRCQEDRDLIKILGKVAYDIFIGEDTSSVVLDRYRLKLLGLTDGDISAVLQVGLLHEVKNVDTTFTKSQLSFMHTSYLEFFVAVHISSYCLSPTQTSKNNLTEHLIRPNISAAEFLRLENVLIMVCGLSPSLTNDVLVCIHQVATTDKTLMEYRRNIKGDYCYKRLVQQIQDTCFRCVTESNSTDQQLRPRVNLSDCIVRTPAQLQMCLSNVESVNIVTFQIEQLQFKINEQFTHKHFTSLSSFLSQAISLKNLYLGNIQCREAGCNGHSIDLSRHQQLQRLHIEFCCQIYVSAVTPITNLKYCKIGICEFSHKQCTSLSSFLSHAISLQRLNLQIVKCKETECDGHCIDLSHHQQLQRLQIEFCGQIHVSGVTPMTNLKSCSIGSCELSHGQGISLSSFLSQAISLEKLKLGNIRFKEAGCDGHSIDLSHHQHLQRLQIDSCGQISVSGVTPITNLKTCKIRHCQLSHEKRISLSSFLSQAVSLEKLELTYVTCKGDECDGHSIDLSLHQQLHRLQIVLCGQMFVSGDTPITYLKTCEIGNCELSHGQGKSLSSFLSQAISLENLKLKHVICKEAECDGHSIDLSRHQQLQRLHIQYCYQISVSGVTSITYLKSCKIGYCKLSHEQCTSLSSFLSQAVSLDKLELEDVTCKEAGFDGLSINLSRHQQLQRLQIEKCDRISVSGVTPTTKLKSCKIGYCTLSHGQGISLSSFLSRAISLKHLQLQDVTCKEAECDGLSINLSRHQQLQRLQIEKCDRISVFGVTPTNKLKSCKIGYCTLSHEQCTSLSSFFSRAISLEYLKLQHVTCKEAGYDGLSIDLSHHQPLQRLYIEKCDWISVSGVMLITNLKSCKIGNCKLSHGQGVSLSSFLSQAISLGTLKLQHVTCKEGICDVDSIDLSRHQQLQRLHIQCCDQISVSGVTSIPCLKSCKIRSCELSHEQSISLSSFLSQAISLGTLQIKKIKCKRDGCDGHSVDLSRLQQLQRLQIQCCDQISVSGVTPITCLKSCKIRYCQLSHEQCILLSSLLSQAISLENLNLKHVTCKRDGCDGHTVNLLCHQQLQRLQIQLCDQISVSGVTSISNLKYCEIKSCKLSHMRCTLLSSFLSQAISLENIKLKYVTCKRDGCGGHCIDLSRHQQPQRLQIEYCDQISVSGVTPTTNLLYFEIKKCQFSHKLCQSLSSFLSQAISLESLKLKHVTCKWDGCDGHSVDLFRHQQLQRLHIQHCDKISVSGVTAITNPKSFQIKYCKLSHEQCTSLSSLLSNAISLESLNLENVRCKEAECDGHSIDLSNHQQLQRLQIVFCGMTPVFGVTTNTNLKLCEIGNCELSHEQCTSLLSFLSQAISLESLELTYVTCEEDGDSIDRSHQQQLQSLQIEHCDQISVSGVAPTTYLKSCEIGFCEFSHDHCISLSSFLSQAISLECLTLQHLTCKEAGCNGHSIDLSHHEQLRYPRRQIALCETISAGCNPFLM